MAVGTQQGVLFKGFADKPIRVELRRRIRPPTPVSSF